MKTLRSTDRWGSGTWVFWGGVMALLCGWVAIRMGLFDLTTTITVDGRNVNVLNMYGTVDHPFHAARAASLLESLKDGEILRWMGQHQGGYPVEFYPIGIAWLDVAIWAVTFGSISILAAHKVAVILIFLLPALSFWLLARGDRMHPATAVLAAAVHFSIPGHWLNGGYEELVGWGLVTNVAGGSLAFLTTAALARFVLNREFGMGVLATVAAAGGAMTNPRSLFAIVIASLAILLVAALTSDDRPARGRVLDAAVRIGSVGGIAFLIAAPVVLALFRYNAEYFFLHYEFYEPLSEYWTAIQTAVSEPAAILALVGSLVAVSMLGRSTGISRAVTVTGIGYAALTVWVATASVVPPLVEQLEAPRLMPYQRQLMVWMAAYAVAMAVRFVSTRVGSWMPKLLPAVTMGGLALFVLVAHVRPLAFVDAEEVAIRDVLTTGGQEHADFEAAIRAADGVLPSGTSMFVIGNVDAWWHQQLWAPAYSDARFYYDDWLWYWHDDHDGPYTPASGYWMPNPSDALMGDYLDRNGIGVVVVSDMWVPSGVPPRESARTNPRLTPVASFGSWDVYTVNDPTALVTRGDSLPVEIEINNQEIHARFEDGEGSVLVRQNWFPRWTATVNGDAVDVVRRDDGYMEIAVPDGAVDVRLVYAVTGMDWVARGASGVGVALLLLGVWRGPGLLRRMHAGGESGDTGDNTLSREGTV